MQLRGRNLTQRLQGDDVALLHKELGLLGFMIDRAEIADKRFGMTTSEAVQEFQRQHGLDPTGVVGEATARRINEETDALKPYVVEGRVISRSRAGVARLRVEIVDKIVGDDVRVAVTTTDDSGGYITTFTIPDLRQRGKEKPDLQTRVFAGETLLGASDVRYDASNRETLNVLLTEEADSALASEHETLTSALSAHVRGNLRDLQEKEGRRDITYLANKTGWDARAVALAALADQFSARSIDATGTPAIPQTFFYALFRAGLPANEDTLYHSDAKTLETVWKKAAEQGVIPKASADQISNLVGRFQALSAHKLLTGPALAGASSFKEVLTASRLNDAQQEQFAELHAAHRTDMAKFWDAVSTSFGPETTKRLRIDGKLGFLTINNAPLMQKVHTTAGANGLSDPLQLAHMGHHRAEPWSQLLTPDVPIPKEIRGDMPEAKRANYAEYLAAQVRLSYPTAAVAQMVRSGELPLTGAAQGVADQVHAFLTEHQGKFEIGLQPVEQYLAANNLQVPSETVKQVKRLERLYQITPSDQALVGLMKRGIDAAYHVVRYDKGTFVQSFAADLGGEDKAALTYDRSVQVHHAVLNIALSYLNARTAPAIGAHSPPNILDPAPAHAADVIAYATLENLFGSMDFCVCEHCRSILSPAAYLVDLLLFLDQPNPPTGTENPQTVLLERRPDIEHLPLTCENTNTALPYIDVVNETLEYFVANSVQNLNGYVGHDTGSATSEDLLASPQFVMDSAYATLRGERFPVSLPFHQPLEALRRYFGKFEVPLPLAMERLRKSDDLERGANPYGWRDILMEEIVLSRDEHAILTDLNAVPLWRMYGFPSATADADVIAGLSNAKQFARHVGISYEDLVSVLKTRFINPNSNLIPKLEWLGVSFATLKALKDGTINDQDFDDLLPTGLTAPDPAEYGGDIKAWVKDNDNYARIMGLITLAIPAGTWTASTPYAKGDLVRPTEPDPQSTLYYECTKAGTSATVQPDWPTIPGEPPVSDNTVEWTYRDAASCLSFEDLAFRYTDPAKLTQEIGAVEFIRLMRFIRLWKKLGWTIEQTDAAICGLYRTDLAPLDAGDIDTAAELDAGFLTLLPRLGIFIRVMRALNLTSKRDLLSLLACWSEIDTHGDTALYRQMFRNPALLAQDVVFADNGYGEFLQHVDVPYEHSQATLEQPILAAAQGKIGYNDSTKRLSYAGVLDTATRDALKAVPGVSPDFQQAVDALFAEQRLDTHAEALRSAFNLTGAEYAEIVAALGYDADTPLTLLNIGPIYRRGWLSRKLKISVRELLLLIQLTGLDPFALPDLTHPAILRLISLVQTLKDRSLKSAAVLYLIWNQDLSGKSAPDPAQVASFARTLRLAFAAVETEFVVRDDPDGAIAQGQMAKVYGADAATFFFGLLNDTLTVEVEFSDLDGTLAPGPTRQAIENAAGKTDTGAPRIAYDDFRKRLSYSGVLTTATRDAIQSAAGVGAVEFNKAVDKLHTENQGVVDPFFARYPELQSPYDAYVADTTHSAVEKRKDLLKAILPELVQRRKRQQALQSVGALANTDLAFAQAFLDPPPAPFPMHAVGHADQAALSDLLALETPGFSVQFFASDTASGTSISAPDVAPNLDYPPAVGGIGNPLPANPTPGAAISGVWRGYLEAPENGFFNLRIEADVGATVTLLLDDKPVALMQTATTQTATLWVNADPIALRTGTLYSINLTVEKVREVVRVQWEWAPKGQGRAVIPVRYLYPAALFERFQETYVRFLKAASLSTGLGLTANELAYFATHSDYHINADGWLNALSVSGNPAPGTASALLKPFEALLDFARVKAEISPADASLLTALKDPTTATQNTDSLLFTINRWNQTSLNDVLGHFGDSTAGLGHFELFRRVYDALALIQKMGVSAKALIQATSNEPTADTVRNFQGALRARYDADSWRDVVRPMNDEMRSLQRDALVAYILHQMRSHPESAHIDTPAKLFEYFLMDVQMDPCMQTSRIRHALSSVQLFIERCLMNLEPRVSPAAINGKQWEWMKRYRVWEAHRKVWLWPENWLEPELRDDQSPFFKETMSELLQSDITEDRAAVALLNYLSKLEEAAKLEPCGIYHVEGDASKRTGDIDHVVARTAGANRKYYYRCREGTSWTPWEQIKLDIEDNPVIPVVWKGRLFLFWLRILKEAASTMPNVPDVASLGDVNPADVIPTEAPKVTVKAILCWSEHFNDTWQPTKTSNANLPTRLFGQFDSNASGQKSLDRSKLGLEAWLEQDGLRVLITGPGGGSSFLLYNTHSLPVRREEAPTPGVGSTTGRRGLDTSSDWLIIDYFRYLDFDPSLTRLVLENMIGDRAVQPHHGLQKVWYAPFFYEDSRHVFYVTSETQLVPVHAWDGFGVAIATKAPVSQIPSLVLEEAIKVEPKAEPDPFRKEIDGIDRAPIQRFVTEDAYISKAIGTMGTIAYGDVAIGMRGGLLDETQHQ